MARPGETHGIGPMRVRSRCVDRRPAHDRVPRAPASRRWHGQVRHERCLPHAEQCQRREAADQSALTGSEHGGIGDLGRGDRRACDPVDTRGQPGPPAAAHAPVDLPVGQAAPPCLGVREESVVPCCQPAGSMVRSSGSDMAPACRATETESRGRVSDQRAVRSSTPTVNQRTTLDAVARTSPDHNVRRRHPRSTNAQPSTSSPVTGPNASAVRPSTPTVDQRTTLGDTRGRR